MRCLRLFTVLLPNRNNWTGGTIVSRSSSIQMQLAGAAERAGAAAGGRDKWRLLAAAAVGAGAGPALRRSHAPAAGADPRLPVRLVTCLLEGSGWR